MLDPQKDPSIATGRGASLVPGDGNGQLWEDERMIGLETKSELLDGGTCVVSVAGELDMSTAPRFKQTLLGVLGSAPASVT